MRICSRLLPLRFVSRAHHFSTLATALLLTISAIVHADVNVAPESVTLASPGPSAQTDALLRDLAALGPAKLTERVLALKAQSRDLRDQSDDHLEQVEALKQQAEAIDTLLVALKVSVADPVAGAAPTPLPPVGAPWTRHNIDSGLRKSEGPRLGDINGDGLSDLSVAWEGQEVARIYLRPGPSEVTGPWTAATVDTTPNVEDSLLVDLDGDGALDVVSSLERGSEQVKVAWGPKDSTQILEPTAWQHAEFKQVEHVSMWMYAEPIYLSPGAPVSLVIGGKNYKSDASAVLGLLVSPKENPRDLAQWQWRPLANASWVMSIEVRDFDGDGLSDILYSDKHGPLAGVHWLKHPGDVNAPGEQWVRTTLTQSNVRSANFLTIADLDKDGLDDILAVVELERNPGEAGNAHRHVQFFRRTAGPGAHFEQHEILVPPGIAQSKGIAVGDIDLDGRNDIVLTSSGAYGDLIGTSWLRYEDTPFDSVWRAYNIAGSQGVKYDMAYLIDLDADGDLDVIANDEKEPDASGEPLGLGVFWYENPAVAR